MSISMTVYKIGTGAVPRSTVMSQEKTMCPMCMTSAAVIAASSATGAGVIGFVALKIRAWRDRRERGATSSHQNA